MTKRVLVTGGSKGIGKQIARILVDFGYEVIICARNTKDLEKTAKELGINNYYSVDIADYAQCEKMIEDIGQIDVLINNAGQYVYSPVEQMTEKDIDALLNVNLKAPYNLIKLCVPLMKKNKWGRIVNIGSISGVIGEANASLYSMTKSAFVGLSKSLALELAQDGITVNTINPGWVETELAQESIESSDFSENEILDTIPQRRYIEPTEIANMVKYIISDEAKGMTGQSISLCAGLSAG